MYLILPLVRPLYWRTGQESGVETVKYSLHLEFTFYLW